MTATEQVRVRKRTSLKLKSYAKARRLKIVEVVDVAINALNSLTAEQQDVLIRSGKLVPSVPSVAPTADKIPA